MQAKSITSVTFILVGSMLTTYNSIGGGWTAPLTALVGYVLFFIGLSRLKAALDAVGQNGVQMLTWATMVGIAASAFSIIPLLGAIPAGILGLIAFVLQLVGLLRIRNSTVIGPEGASGVTLLLGAAGIMVLASLLGIIPFAGGFIKSVIAFVAFLIIPFGWIKIQSALVEYKWQSQTIIEGDFSK